MISVVILGKGTVGRAFIRQIADIRAPLLERGIDLRVHGIVGKTNFLFRAEGIDEECLRDVAEGRGEFAARDEVQDAADVTEAVRGIHADHHLIVDLTAEPNIAAHTTWIRAGWHVVTANKHPLVASFREYDALMTHARRGGDRMYRYSTTVGAGLPIISTLQSMVGAGDEVLEIRAAVSGTLGFIFSACEEGMTFADAVREAKERGYSEPDPREDLSGKDVARKALIMARVLGSRLELDDMAIESLVPESLERGTVEDFFAALPDASRHIDDRFRTLRERGRTLRYLLTVTPESVRVGVEEVEKESDFGRLHGPENMFVVRSRHYASVPLIIRGPGAGAEVTAARVLADLLHVAMQSTFTHAHV